MTRDPWTDPDPQPGDFDAWLDSPGPHHVVYHPGDPNIRITVVSEDDPRLPQNAPQRPRRTPADD